MTLAAVEAPQGQQAMAEDEAVNVAKEMAKELADLRVELEMYGDYYIGRQVMPQQPARLTRKYAELLRVSTSNWCRLVVDVVAERLFVGAIKSSQDDDLDTDAWSYWQANNLDSVQVPVHSSALVYGRTYASVWPREQGQAPRIAGESPLQVHARRDEVTGDITAVVKVWEGVQQRYLYVTVYDAVGVYRFRSAQAMQALESYPSRAPMEADLSQVDLVPRDQDDDGGWFLPNPMGEPPFVMFPTMPDLLGGTQSEIAGVIPIQDRINRTTFHRLLTQEFHAYPQRWVTGIDVEKDPETGEPIKPFDAAQDELWTATDPQTTFGQFNAADPGGFLSAISHDVQALATQSRTPPHYLTGGMGQFPSGESVRATEYGLSRKVENRQTTYGDAWSDVIRLAAKAAKNTALSEDTAVRVLWKDVEARTEGEIVDALLKMSTLGVPQKVLFERWGASPQEAERWATEAAAAAAQAAAAATEPSAGIAPPTDAGQGLALGNGTVIEEP